MISAIFYFALWLSQAPGRTLPLERPEITVRINTTACSQEKMIEALEAATEFVPGIPLVDARPGGLNDFLGGSRGRSYYLAKDGEMTMKEAREAQFKALGIFWQAYRKCVKGVK